MKKILLLGAALAVFACQAVAGERGVTRYGDPQPDPETTVARAVWGAIAYSPSTGKNGIFWGAPTRDDAGKTAVKYCQHAANQKDDDAQADCALTIIVYNDWDDRQIGRTTTEENRAPHCGALAVSDARSFSAKRGVSLREARDSALAACSAKGRDCKVVQDICT